MEEKYRKFYTALGAECYGKSIKNKNFPLEISIFFKRSFFIEETKDGLSFKDNLLGESFILNPEDSKKTALERCIKALPEYLKLCINFNLSNEEGARKKRFCGNAWYNTHAKLIKWDPDGKVFEGIIITEEEFKTRAQEPKKYSAFNDKYNIKDLICIRWDAYGKGGPQAYCQQIIDAGGELIKWEGLPAADCIFMLFKFTGDLPPLPAGNLLNSDNTILHEIISEKKLRSLYPEYIE